MPAELGAIAGALMKMAPMLMTAVSGAGFQLPGFTASPPMPALPGFTAFPGFPALPGFTPSDPLPGLPGFTPSEPLPALPGHTPVDPTLGINLVASEMASGEGNGTRENPWMGGKAYAWRDGNDVIKQMREVTKGHSAIGSGDEIPVRLTPAQQAQLANDTVEFTNQVHGAMPDIVPKFTSSGAGQIRVPYVEGKTMDDLAREGGVGVGSAHEAAYRAQQDAIARANGALGLRNGETGELASGSTVSIDDNPANFRFNADGSIKSWFDPVLVTPVGKPL